MLPWSSARPLWQTTKLFFITGSVDFNTESITLADAWASISMQVAAAYARWPDDRYGHDLLIASRFGSMGADLRGQFMRNGAPRIGRPRRHNPMVDPQGPESEFVQISRPKEPVVDCIARGETAGRPSQKLPSTAIYCYF
jgi:hypothetical protein